MTKVLIDENLSEYFARGLQQMQYPLQEGVEVLSITDEYGKGVADEDWIPDLGKKKGVFITQDLMITRTKQQLELVKNYQLGAFFLDVPKSYLYWEKCLVLINSWRKIVKVIKKEKRPFAYIITPRKFEKMPI